MVNKNFSVENARIFYKNFAGKESDYNASGSRNFCMEIPKDLADQLANDGWNVKIHEPKEEGDEPTFYIKVMVSYKYHPPKIVLISNGNKVELDEDTVEQLDWADITNVDVVISSHQYTVGKRSGTNGYVKAMYVTVEDDPFAAKYANIGSNESRGITSDNDVIPF